MTELLSLPRRRSHAISLPTKKFPSGLPFNSLPGWEQIPLNLKLPMLKCPGNHVIFSKNKIGQSLRRTKQEFDTFGNESLPEYNPLHDTNLKNFYTNERNLKRLRANGEITADNDVICNLKDFNEYRQQLHKSQLHYILKEMNRLENEQHDRLLISHAENITKHDQQNLSAGDYSHAKIIQRKLYLDQQRAERFQSMYKKTLEKFAHLQKIRTLNETRLQNKKAMKQLKFERNSNARLDHQRKHLICLKKRFQFKTDRLNKNLRKLYETRLKHYHENQLESWHKRLAARIANQTNTNRLLTQVNAAKQISIETHKHKYQRKWLRIQSHIQKSSLDNRKNFNWNTQQNKPKVQSPQNQTFSIAEFKSRFEKLLDSEVCEALNTVAYLEDKVSVPFERDDHIYKAAQYIMQVILKNFHKNLAKDKMAYVNLYDRVDKFLDDIKQFVTFRATQIIAALQDRSEETKNQHLKRNSVSFSYVPSTIGVSSYKIHPLIEVKEVFTRKPTPVGSLTSIIMDSTTSLVEKTNCSNLSRNDLVFIEHYVTKMKRELIVGVGGKVFAAIQCHHENKPIIVRPELLDIDRKFLLHQVTKAILSYAVNPLNYEAIIKLCISVLASDIISSLQKQLLKPTPDLRRAVKPCMECTCKQNSNLMCFFCQECN